MNDSRSPQKKEERDRAGRSVKVMAGWQRNKHHRILKRERGGQLGKAPVFASGNTKGFEVRRDLREAQVEEKNSEPRISKRRTKIHWKSRNPIKRD